MDDHWSLNSLSKLSIICTPLSLTHWGRVTHICVCNLTIICSDNGLSPDRRQAITWTNVGILLTNVGDIFFKIHIFSFRKMHFTTLSEKRRPFLCRPQCVKKMYGYTNQVIYTRPKWWLSDTNTSLNLYERWYNVPNNPSLNFKPDLPLKYQAYVCGEIRVYFGNFFVKR